MAETRPLEFNQDAADRICLLISESEKGLQHIISQDVTLPSKKTLFKWLAENEAFRNQYAHAREAQADFMAEQMLTIADASENDTILTDFGEKPNNEWINRSKLRVDTRKWLASKLAPKKYGDKLDVTTDGDKINSKQVFKIGDTVIEF